MLLLHRKPKQDKNACVEFLFEDINYYYNKEMCTLVNGRK